MPSQRLWLKCCQELGDVSYHHEASILFIHSEDEMATQLPYILHITAWAYDKAASMKDPLGRHLFLELMELILQECFETATEPLLFTQPDELAHMGLDPVEFVKDQPHPLATASLGYVKGFARVAAILAFLRWRIEKMWI